MTTAANTNNSDAVEAGVGGTKSPASTALALYRHALDLCERLGIGPQSVVHVLWEDPPINVWVWPEEWRPEWGALRPSGEAVPDVVEGSVEVEGITFRCACGTDAAARLGLTEAS